MWLFRTYPSQWFMPDICEQRHQYPCLIWWKICFNVNDSSVPYDYVPWQNEGKNRNFTQNWLAMMLRSNMLVWTEVLTWCVYMCSLCTNGHLNSFKFNICLNHFIQLHIPNVVLHLQRLEVGKKHLLLFFGHDLLFTGI